MTGLRTTGFLALASWATFGGHAAEPVDVALVLAADVSLSMSMDELAIQRAGYVAALRHPEVVAAITSGRHGRIAVAVVEWAGANAQSTALNWTIIEDAASAERASRALAAAVQTRLRRTSISAAIDFAADLFAELPATTERRIIDVSGDGPNNQGEPVRAARDRAIGEGIVINGLPLMIDNASATGFDIDHLDAYYRECVVGGPGAFVHPVRDWEEFPEAVRRKLVLEIAGTGTEIRFVAAGAPTDCLIGEKIWLDRMPDLP